MEIIIRSQESGWDVGRRIELPDDEKLVRDILRRVKRHMAPPKEAGGMMDQTGQGEKEKPEDPTEGLTPEEPKKEKHQELPEERRPLLEDARVVFETGVRGFLLIRCAGCGKERAFSAREPMNRSICRECGHETHLENLAAAELRCPACGKTWHYKTNSEEPEIACRCVICGEKMTGRWSKKLRRYIPSE